MRCTWMWYIGKLLARAHRSTYLKRLHPLQATTEYATMSEDPAGYPRAFVVKRLITFVGIVIG